MRPHQVNVQKMYRIQSHISCWLQNIPLSSTNIVALNKSDCLDNILQSIMTVLVAENNIRNTNIVTNKNSENYRSDVIHKITHSKPTPFQFYTLSILHSLFKSYTFQSYTRPILHSFQSYTLPILHSPNLTL